MESEFAGLVGAQKEPVPFSILVKGTVNGTPLTVSGAGVVPRLGVYEGILNFSALPPSFHPCAISTYIMSICCYANAAERTSALNIASMGAAGYATRRVLTFEEGQIVIEGEVAQDEAGLTFTGTISGEATLPEDLAGNSIYIKKIEPSDEGMTLTGVGEGSLFRSGGGEVRVRIDTVHTLRASRLARPLQQTQFRIVTESGQLVGRSYRASIHSILDGENAMAKVEGM